MSSISRDMSDRRSNSGQGTHSHGMTCRQPWLLFLSIRDKLDQTSFVGGSWVSSTCLSRGLISPRWDASVRCRSFRSSSWQRSNLSPVSWWTVNAFPLDLCQPSIYHGERKLSAAISSKLQNSTTGKRLVENFVLNVSIIWSAQLTPTFVQL